MTVGSAERTEGVHPINGVKRGGDAGVVAGRGESAGHPERRPEDTTENLGPEVKNLIETGGERGFVTYDELNKALPDDRVSPEKLDAVLQKRVKSATQEGAKDEAGFEPPLRSASSKDPGSGNPRRPPARRRSTIPSGFTSPGWAGSH